MLREHDLHAAELLLKLAAGHYAVADYLSDTERRKLVPEIREEIPDIIGGTSGLLLQVVQSSYYIADSFVELPVVRGNDYVQLLNGHDPPPLCNADCGRPLSSPSPPASASMPEYRPA